MIKIGFGSADITPEVGEYCSIRMVPAKRCTGIHDRLSANALYFDNGTEELLLVSCDSVQISSEVVERVKATTTDTFGITADKIVVAATHAHHAPEILGDEYIDNRHQVERLIAGCNEAVRICMGEIRAAKMGWSHVLVASAINRFQLRIGGANVKLVDRRVDILRICESDGTHRGVLWHYAAHPTTALRDDYLVSRDYYGEVNDLLSDSLGGFSVFMQGACANINLTVHERRFEKTHHHANHIASRILSVADTIAVSDDACLGSDMVSVESPITSRISEIEVDPNPEEIKHYFQNLDKYVVDHSRRDEEFESFQALRGRAQRLKLYEEFVQTNRSSETVIIQAFLLGEYLGITIPGEPFVELQFSLQEAFPDTRALVFGYANGHVGYIPDPDSFEKATYETIPSTTKRAGKYAGELMVKAGVAMLHGLLSKTSRDG